MGGRLKRTRQVTGVKACGCQRLADPGRSQRSTLLDDVRKRGREIVHDVLVMLETHGEPQEARLDA